MRLQNSVSLSSYSAQPPADIKQLLHTYLVDCTKGSVPVGKIRTVTTDNQTNHNDNYVNYSTLPLLNTITQKCNFLYF